MLLSKLALGAAAIPLAVGGVAGVTGQQDADKGARHEHRAEVHAAIESGDYDTWYSAVTSHDHSPFAEHASEELFAEMQDIHKLMEAGEREAAKEAMQSLASELGIEMPRHKGPRGHKMMKHNMPEEARDKLRLAVEENDFESWKGVLLEFMPEEHQDKISEERFAQLVERFEARGN
jgi:hypothetical protein